MKTGKVIKLSLLLLISLVLVAVILLFIPDIQKKLLESQLSPHVSEFSVAHVSINPFSARIDELRLKQDGLNVHIGHLEGQFSLFKMLFGRLKIDSLILEDTQVENFSEPVEDQSPSPLPLFPGIFPYLNHGFIYDIGQLSLSAEYLSPATGKIDVTLKGEDINELTDNGLTLLTDITDIEALPELDHINITGHIYLNQDLRNPIDAQTTELKISLQEVHSTPQYINIDLKMAELDEKPDNWDEFYFTNQHTRYIGELVKPESIHLKVRQTDSKNKALSVIDFDGRYNGNNGILQGKLRINTDEDFLQIIKSLRPPKIKSNIIADFSYSLITLDGHIDLDDTIQVKNLKFQSLPEQFHLNNQLSAEIRKQHLTVKKLTLALTENEHTYVLLNALQPLHINLDNLPAFLENHTNQIADLQISNLPLTWFSEFIPDFSIPSGLLSIALSVSVDGQNLLARTNHPLTVNTLTLLQNQLIEKQPEKQPDEEKITEDAEQHSLTATHTQTVADSHSQDPSLQTEKAKTIEQETQTPQTVNNVTAENKQTETEAVLMADKLNLTTNLSLTANTDRLDINLPDFTLTQGNNDQLHSLINNSIHLQIDKLLNQDIKDKPIKLDTNGEIHINEILNLPVVKSGFDKPVPEALSLKYTLKLNGVNPDWTIEEFQSTIHQNNKKDLLHLVSKQPVKLSQTEEQLELYTEGELLNGYLKHINLAWASPYIEGMDISGSMNEMNFTLSAMAKNDYSLMISAINFYNISAKETGKQDNRILLDNLNLASQLNIKYTPDVISIIYPKLTLDQGQAGLIRNNGSVLISDYTQPEKQLLIAQGKLNGFVHNIMNLEYVQHLAKQKLKAKSLLDAEYHLEITQSNIKINKSTINLNHPETHGSLKVNTIKPVAFALPDPDSQANSHYAFSPNGHLRVTLKDFDSKPYENLLKESGIAFDHINGQLDLRQKNSRQEIIFKTPLKIANLHFLDEKSRPLDPFDLELDLQMSQKNNLLTGELKNLSLQFLDQKEKALETQMKFNLDLNRKIPVRSLEGHLNAILTQWLEQPAAIPENTLQQGSLATQFNIDKKGNIKHYWQINDLIDQQNHQIVKSITIDGSGQLHSASEIELDLPIAMDSESGQTVAEIAATVKLNKHKSLNLDINGKTIYLNDILKLLDAISPPETVSSDRKESDNDESDASETSKPPIRTAVDTEPFWKSAMDIEATLSIDKLYQTDYLAFDRIKGKLSLNDREFKSHEISALFHDSPLKLDSIIQFNASNAQPYDVDLVVDIKDFNWEEFKRELDPTTEALFEGVFNIDFKVFGQMDNIEEWRNQLLFDAHFVSQDGLYRFISQDSPLLLSSGYTMALVGEVVSLVPTAGFGLGIMPRLVRFIAVFPYDKIDIHLVRNADKNTTIKHFEIFSPELYMNANGGITFMEDTRLFDSPLQMTARLDLAGEGAAIFYGLDLLTREKNEYGYWTGPEIIFGGTVNHPTDNFDEIVQTAKKGTVAGGITRPFSGIIGDFKYRWFSPKPDYQEAITDQRSMTTEKQSTVSDQQKAIKADSVKSSSGQTEKKPKAVVKPKPAKKSFFEETFQ